IVTARGLSTTGSAITAAAEKLEVFQDNLHAAALLSAGLVLPLVEPEAAFDEERTTLGAVLRNRLTLTTPRFDIDEGGFLTRLTRLVLERAIDGQTELADGRALGRAPQSGVARQVADEEAAVEIGHGRR